MPNKRKITGATDVRRTAKEKLEEPDTGKDSSQETEKSSLTRQPSRDSLLVLRRSIYVLTALLSASSAHAQNAVGDPIAARAFQAQATVVNGQVTRLRDDQPWAISSGDQVPIQQTLSTGQDGYAQLKVAGGSSFEIFSNSKVAFRQNISNPNDIVDVLAGRVRLQLRPRRGEQQRVFSPSAIISAHVPTALALAVDEDDTVRIDVIEGEVRVLHTRLPGNEVLVRAIDSILVKKNEEISRRVDRGTLYRYRARIITALTFGHAGHGAEPIEGNKLLARSHASRPLWLSF